MSDSKKIFHIIGVGNKTRFDDGIAIAILEALEKEALPTGVKLTDLGTGGIDIAFALDGWKHALILDAVDIKDQKPGDIIEFMFSRDNLPEVKGISSSHGFTVVSSLKLAFALGEYQLPKEIFFIGIQAKKLAGMGVELSPEVEKTIPQVVEKVKLKIKNVFSEL